MERRRLGRTAVEVSRLGLGGAPLGNLFRAVTEEDARDTVLAAWAAGLRYFDTAPLYGHGLSERRLGAALRDRPREDFVLSTKVGRRLEARAPAAVAGGVYVDVPPVAPVYDYGYEGTLRSVEASLDPSGLNATSLTSPSCPWNERILAPVSSSLMSIRPESSRPSVTKTPLRLQARRPPTPGTSKSSREATTARWRASSASRRAVPSAERVASTASMASKTLTSGSASTFARAAAASSLAVATPASRSALLR